MLIKEKYDELDIHWTYGNHSKYGWGGLKHVYTYKDFIELDFEQEWESKQDLKSFWKNRKNILALPEMTYWKYLKQLWVGIKLNYKGYLR